MNRSAEQLDRSCLRAYLGSRINLFRAMHRPGFRVSEDRTLVALWRGPFALVAHVGFRATRRRFYVRDCRWYRADLEQLPDHGIPDRVREELLELFAEVLR